jgi:FkbM family methyltransferase
MIEILKIEEGRVEFITKKNYNKVTIRVKSGYSSEIFYTGFFEEFITGVVYWIDHPIFFIEDETIFEIYEDDKIFMSLRSGEGEFTKNPKHLKNQLEDLVNDDELLSKYNGSYWEIFVEDCFAVNKNIPEVYTNVKNFIDLGANCGFFSRMIFNKNPNAKGVIVEPNPQLEDVIRKTNSKFNYILKINSFSDRRDKTVNFNFAEKYNHTAVSHESDIDIGFQPNPHYKFYSETVKTIDMVSIMKEFGKDEIVDILKVDIEGGEQHLNGKNNQELIKKYVKYVLVETHSKKIKTDILENFTDVFYLHSENPTHKNFNHLILVNKKL